MNVSVEVKGLDKAIARLKDEHVRREIKTAVNQSVTVLEHDMKEYPDQTKDSYKRTGMLGRAWTTKVTGGVSGFVGKVGNNVRYVPWVQSKMFQAWMHKDLWKNTDQQVLANNRARIIGFFQSALKRI